MAINSVTLGGNATRDAEVRMTKSGNYAVGIGIAVNEWKDGADYTNFFDVTMFVKVDNERQKSYIASVRKGDKIVVQGHLRYSTWEKDGSKRSKVEVIATELFKLASSQATPTAPMPRASAPTYQPQDFYTEDTPF